MKLIVVFENGDPINTCTIYNGCYNIADRSCVLLGKGEVVEERISFGRFKQLIVDKNVYYLTVESDIYDKQSVVDRVLEKYPELSL